MTLQIPTVLLVQVQLGLESAYRLNVPAIEELQKAVSSVSGLGTLSVVELSWTKKRGVLGLRVDVLREGHHWAMAELVLEQELTVSLGECRSLPPVKAIAVKFLWRSA